MKFPAKELFLVGNVWYFSSFGKGKGGFHDLLLGSCAGLDGVGEVVVAPQGVADALIGDIGLPFSPFGGDSHVAADGAGDFWVVLQRLAEVGAAHVLVHGVDSLPLEATTATGLPLQQQSCGNGDGEGIHGGIVGDVLYTLVDLEKAVGDHVLFLQGVGIDLLDADQRACGIVGLHGGRKDGIDLQPQQPHPCQKKDKEQEESDHPVR